MKWFKRKDKKPKVYGNCITCDKVIYISDSLEEIQIHMLRHQIVTAEESNS